MAYPWAGFGTFKFQRDEHPIENTDTDWTRDPSYSESRPLGSSTDSFVALAVGSATRSYEIYITPDRFRTLEALVNTSASHVDWNRPFPDQRNAFLKRLSIQEADVTVLCRDGVTRRRIRAMLELASQ